MRKAVFLDRDGTIARDAVYCSRPEDFNLFPEIGKSIRLLNDIDLMAVLVTNQSGIGRGFFTEKDLKAIHDKMKVELRKEGARLDAIYYCPHHPDEGCDCRKPNIGMLLRASNELHIDLTKSYLVGDRFLDMAAANKAGCKAVLVPREEPELSELCARNRHGYKLDFVASDFATAVQWIKVEYLASIRRDIS
jgi:D-sedoheptulose 7-phosphate isomerase